MQVCMERSAPEHPEVQSTSRQRSPESSTRLQVHEEIDRMLLAAITRTRSPAAEAPRPPSLPIEPPNLQPFMPSLPPASLLQVLTASQQSRQLMQQPLALDPVVAQATQRAMPSMRVADPAATLQALQVRELIADMQQRHEQQQQQQEQQRRLFMHQLRVQPSFVEVPPAPPLVATRLIPSPHSLTAEQLRAESEFTLLGKRPSDRDDVASILSSLLSPSLKARRLSVENEGVSASAAGLAPAAGPAVASSSRTNASVSESTRRPISGGAQKAEVLAQARLEALATRTITKSGGGSVRVSGAVQYRGVRQRPWGKCGSFHPACIPVSLLLLTIQEDTGHYSDGWQFLQACGKYTD
jgi:hypothetical protein